MNRHSEEQQLLNEVLAESLPDNRREQLLEQTLRQIRSQRHWRQTRRTVGALAIVLGLGFLIWPRPHYPFVQASPPKPYVLVETQPLPEANIVKTIPLNSVSQISSDSNVIVIATATEPHLAREIDDAALLSLAAPNPVILVRQGPHSAELVFAHTTDAEAPEHQREPQ
jgi:hypothetical protein